MRMTTFIISMIIVSLFVTGFGLVLTNADDEYDIGYDDTEIATFSKMSEIQTLTTELKSNVENNTIDRSLSDVIGGFIADGKNTLMLAANSFDLFDSMTRSGMEKVGVPEIFPTALYAAVIIIIFIGIILGTILGKNL